MRPSQPQISKEDTPSRETCQSTACSLLCIRWAFGGRHKHLSVNNRQGLSSRFLSEEGESWIHFFFCLPTSGPKSELKAEGQLRL